MLWKVRVDRAEARVDRAEARIDRVEARASRVTALVDRAIAEAGEAKIRLEIETRLIARAEELSRL